MPISQTSFDNIKVGYISETEGYVRDISIADANAYAELNPETEFIFIDGDEKVRFLTISEVNALTPKNLLRSDPCLTGDQLCGPPKLKFFGGSGVGATANPVVDVNGNLIAVDLVSGGFGYISPPQVQVLDPCNIGSGAVLETEIENGVVIKVIVRDSGQGYLPPPQTVPQYPAVIELTGVTVTNPGFNHNCGVDTIEIIPSNGSVLSYDCDPFGKIKSVSVNKGGRFTELPQIRMNTETGFNATFVPEFNVIRDPEPIDPVVIQADLVQVFNLVGLNINGYIDGKPYYGNVYFVDGIKFAGTSDKSGTNIQVYNTRLDSLQKRDTGARIVSDQVEEAQVVVEEQQDTVESISSPSRGTYSTTPTSAPATPATPATTTTPASGGTYSAPATPTPSPAPSTPSTPAPPSSSPPSSGGGGGYGGGY